MNMENLLNTKSKLSDSRIEANLVSFVAYTDKIPDLLCPIDQLSNKHLNHSDYKMKR